MKKTLAILLFCTAASSAQAQMAYMDEVKTLGTIAGKGLACGASKYHDFELLARAILLTKAANDKQQEEGLNAYNEEKANAYLGKRMDNYFECKEINQTFDAQQIFQATLYADGTIKMPDGQILTPRQPYDAAQVYDRNQKQVSDSNANATITPVFNNAQANPAPTQRQQARRR